MTGADGPPQVEIDRVVKQWRFWIGVAISLICLFLAFRNQDLTRVMQELAGADYRLLAPAVLLYFIGVGFRTVRWQALLNPVKRLSLRQLFPLVVIGYMANNLLPARGGELVRVYLLGWRTGVRKTTSLATVAIERIFDGLTMIVFILMAAPLIGLNAQVAWLTGIATLLFVGLLGGLILFATMPWAQRLALSIIRRLLPAKIGERLTSMLTAFVAGLGSLRSASELVRVVVSSLLAWVCEAGMYLLIAIAFGLDVGWPVALLTTAVANLFTLLPSTPGYVGIFEAGVLAVLVGLLNRPEAVALSYAIVLHAALWMPVTVLGLIYLSRESLSWRSLSALRDHADDAAPPTELNRVIQKPESGWSGR